MLFTGSLPSRSSYSRPYCCSCSSLAFWERVNLALPSVFKFWIVFLCIHLLLSASIRDNTFRARIIVAAPEVRSWARLFVCSKSDISAQLVPATHTHHRIGERCLTARTSHRRSRLKTQAPSISRFDSCLCVLDPSERTTECESLTDLEQIFNLYLRVSEWSYRVLWKWSWSGYTCYRRMSRWWRQVVTRSSSRSSGPRSSQSFKGRMPGKWAKTWTLYGLSFSLKTNDTFS